MNLKEYCVSYILIIVICGIFSFVFYESMIIFIIFLLPSYFYLKIIKKWLLKKRIQKLNLQFKDFCMSITAQLSAGYSLENSLVEVYREMSQLYGKKSYVCIESKFIITKLKLNITIEKCFENLADRCGLEDINLFSQVVCIAKRSGGDMISIVRNAADSISRKIETEREIRTIINSKKYEQTIMNAVPLFIVCYVRISSPNMMNIMYETFIGRVIMTICLFAYSAAFMLGVKLSNVEI